MHRTLRTTAAALGAAALLALAAPLSANAHVSLEENTASPGSYTTLTFRVPNETQSASTTKLTITLPSDATLLASVSYVPVPGWTAQLVVTPLPSPITAGDDTVTEAVTQVVWTAQSGSEYGPGSEGVFKLFVGPIPTTGQLKLPVEQAYSDGSVVSWSDSADGQHPAPVLYITDKAPSSSDPDSAPQATVAATTADAGPDVLARALGGIGLVLGAIALIVAVVGRRPRSSTTTED